jgi:predicted component of type VI protein secretion system
MKAELVPLNGDPPIPITRDLTVVGRREFCDVQIDHIGLSKRHCVLVKTDGLLVVRDLATTNGTKVNGQKIRWAALLPNDRLTLGAYKVKVYLGPDEAPSPSQIGDRTFNGAAVQGKAKAAPRPRVGASPLQPAAPATSPVAGFAAPSPLQAPLVSDAEVELVDDDDDAPAAESWPEDNIRPTNSNGEPFIIELE